MWEQIRGSKGILELEGQVNSFMLHKGVGGKPVE